MSCSGGVPGSRGCTWAPAGQRGPAGGAEPPQKGRVSSSTQLAHLHQLYLEKWGEDKGGAFPGSAAESHRQTPRCLLRVQLSPSLQSSLGYLCVRGCPGMVRDELHGCPGRPTEPGTHLGLGGCPGSSWARHGEGSRSWHRSCRGAGLAAGVGPPGDSSHGALDG